MELILVRHGLPQSTVPAEGPPDPELSPTGRDQAEQVARWLADEQIDAVVSSPLRRAVQTAEPTAAQRGLPVVPDPGVREIYFGEQAYTPMEQIAPDDPRVQLFRTAIADEDGELLTSFRAQVSGGLAGIVERHPDQNVLVACHGGVVNAALAEILRIPRTFAFDIGYASITRLRPGRGGRLRVHSVNEQGHLRT